MTDESDDLIEGLVHETIAPALYEDFVYESQEEFDEIKRALIESIRDIEYVDQTIEGYEEEEE